MARGLGGNYLTGGYFDERGYLKNEAVVDWAQRVAQVLSDQNMTSTGLRRFFTRVRALETARRAGGDFEKLKTELQKLKAQAAYAANRSGVSVPSEFVDFINRNVDLAVRDERSFRAFVDHFECVVAFFKEKDAARRGR